LPSKDFFNIKLSNSSFNKTLNNNITLLAQKYKDIISQKNRDILFKNTDNIMGTLITGENKLIEDLLREYLQTNKIPGINLKNQILEDLNFIESEVVKPLGISMPNKGKRSSFLGK
jgi:hypothetical protein